MKDLTALMGAFRSTFLPQYADKKFSFKEMIKQVLWLADREQRVLGNVQGYSWQALADYVIDKKHILHLALRLRRQDKITPAEASDLLKKSEEYLTFLEGKYK